MHSPDGWRADPDRRDLGDPGRDRHLLRFGPRDTRDRRADDHRRKIASLKHYLVVAQDRRVVQVHSRAGELWRERFVASGVLELDDPPVRLELDGLYAKTDVAA